MKNNFKDLRKAAFAVAFGVTMGKYAAERLQAVIDGAIIGICDIVDKHINKATHDADKKSEYECENKASEE